MNKDQPNSTTASTEKRFRVALIASQHTVSQYPIFLEHLLAGLVEKSINVVLVCPPDSNVDSIVSPAVKVIRHPAIKLPLLGHQNKRILIDRLSKFEPSLLHCLCQSQAPLARYLSRHLELPYVLTVNSLPKRWNQFTISAKRCAKIIAPAKSIADNLLETYPRFSERIKQINPGTFSKKKPSCFSDQSQLASMIVANPLQDAGDLENFCRAARHLVLDGYEFMIVVIGTGRSETQLRKSLDEFGLSQIVIIAPRLEPWHSVLAAGDIFVQPKATDAFNPLLLEAMSVGAAVAGCQGGVDDLLIDGENCILFDPDDEVSIYESLQKLFNSRELAQKLATGAQENLRENYSVSAMVSNIVDVYQDAKDWLSE
jgi:glycosyltransferase involved in cell wall biosynthesis